MTPKETRKREPPERAALFLNYELRITNYELETAGQNGETCYTVQCQSTPLSNLSQKKRLFFVATIYITTG